MGSIGSNLLVWLIFMYTAPVAGMQQISGKISPQGVSEKSNNALEVSLKSYVFPALISQVAAEAKLKDLEDELKELEDKLRSAEAKLKNEKKISHKEGYAQGMDEGKLVVSSLEQQLQNEVHNVQTANDANKKLLDKITSSNLKQLELHQKMNQARNQLDMALKSIAPQASYFVCLQEVSVLLEQACQPPKQ